MRTRTFTYSTYSYNYSLVFLERKTLSLVVQPDLKIVLKAPIDADKLRIEKFLKKKWKWLEKQLTFFKKYQKKTVDTTWLSGKSVLHLGKQYKLKVVPGNKFSVKLSKGKLELTTPNSSTNQINNKKLLDEWYLQQAEIIFRKRFKVILRKFDYVFIPELIIRRMNKRWGSYLRSGKVILNPELVKASTDCIDYVMTHELCHVKYQNHSMEYYKFLERMYPKWRAVKAKLEERFI